MFFQRSKNYSTLYAVYDLEVFPPNYEIAVFLARVEVERISLGLDNITLIIVAGAFGGVSARGILSHGFESAQWRVAHIINAIGRLMPSCKGVHHICDRNILAKLCEEKISYPADLTERPSPEHFYLGPLVHAYHSGVEVRPFRASRAAKIHTKSFIDNFLNGAPFITISLRENDYQHTRNSNFDMYQKICFEVSKLGLSVVVIRDTDAAFSSPVNWHKSIECPVASFDLDIRMAFYEQALLNLSVSSGPSWGLMLLSPKINFFLTNILDTNYRSTSEEFLKNAQGIRKGDQYPFSNEFQRLCWKDDSEDIALEFMELLLRRLKVC